MATLEIVFLFIVYVGKSLQGRIVPSPPSITAGPKPYPMRSWNPELGDRVYVYLPKEKNTRLQCVASGNTPKLSYDWIKDGKLIDFNSTEVTYKNNTLRIYKEHGLGTLNIHHVQESDYGIYQCRAGSASSQALSLSKKVELIEAHISSFQNNNDRPPKVVLLGQYVLLTCDPPYSNPKAILKWTTDDTLKEMTLNDRIVMDYEGNLHFTNIAKEDGGKMYSCFASLSFIGFYSKGPFTSLSVKGDKPANQPAKIQWRSAKDVIGVKGEPVRFMCIFSGHPVPKILWHKEGRPSTTLSEGHEFVINSVQFNDKGIYICAGRNPVTDKPQNVTFTLNVQAKPSWKIPPVDTRVSVGDSASINCEAEGIPSPNVEWFIDGKPFKEIPGKRQLQGDILQVTSLTKKESMVVQCNATNSHGSLFSDVYINVLALPPEITNWTKEVRVAAGNNAVLTCEHNGYPTPTLQWKRGPQLLNGDRYNFTQNSITIFNVSKHDQGIVQCISKNTEGQMEEEIRLIVRDKTKIIHWINEKTVDEGTDVMFSCFAMSDPKENIKYTWRKNGQHLQDLGVNQLSCEKNCTVLKILKVKSIHSGNYTCIASNRIDEDQRTVRLKVKAPPHPPNDVKITSCGDWKLGLKWSAGFNNFHPIVNYTIEYNTPFHPDEWIFLFQTSDNRTQINGLPLSAGVEYTFRIKALNVKGFSIASKPTTLCKTDAKKPARHPDGVKIKNWKEGYLFIEWKAMDPMDFNGENFSYKIFVRKLHAKDDKISSYIVAGEKNSKLIKTNDTYQKYGVKVAAWNIKGTPLPGPVEIFGYSGMGVPTIRPKNFALDETQSFTHETATFVWDAVPSNSTELKGKFDGYVIRYWKKTSPGILKRIEIPARVLSVVNTSMIETQRIRETIHNLPAFSELQLDVLVKNTEFESKPSDLIDLVTPEGVPSEVEKLRAEKRGENFLELGWFMPKRVNGNLKEFKIMCQKVTGGMIEKDVEEILNMDSNVVAMEMIKHRIEGLEPNTLYRVVVFATTRVGAGSKTFLDVMTADRAPLSRPIVYVDQLPEKNGFNISWSSVSPVNTVNMKISGGAYNVVKKSNSSQNWVLVTEGLEVGRTYIITVTAEDNSRKATSEEIKVIFSSITRNRRDDAIFQATWFIIVMVAIAILILVIIIVCLLLKRNRGDKYNVQERENLHGIKNEEMKKPVAKGGFDENSEKQPLAENSFDDMDKRAMGSDKDSLEEYGDVDPSKFNEDGSFIGQYGNQQATTPSEAAVTSAMHNLI